MTIAIPAIKVFFPVSAVTAPVIKGAALFPAFAVSFTSFLTVLLSIFLDLDFSAVIANKEKPGLVASYEVLPIFLVVSLLQPSSYLFKTTVSESKLLLVNHELLIFI